MTAETSNARGEWVLVPREPTEAMLDAMHSRIRILCDPAARTADIQNDRGVWAAMLAGSPPAPVSVPLDRLTALDGLVDRIAEAIRDGAGLAEGDPPWERLGEERRAPWRADAKRALSVIKESLTAERGAGVGGPDAQYADADALIAHLDDLYDDNGQGGDKWDVAQAAIAGIRAARTPPPAAARGDVRAVLQEMRDRQVARRFKSQTLTDWADRIEQALAAEGVQAGGVEQGLLANFQAAWFTVCDALDEADPDWMMGDKVGAEAAAAKIRALSQQPEARGVVDEAMVVAIADHVRKWMGPIGRDLSVGHVATLHGAIVDGIHAAALTGERNG